MKCTYTLQDLPRVAGDILDQIPNKTILFYGDMGVGKTTLIKELAQQLGAEDPVSSPTFSLVNEYALPQDKLYHFDFYRLEDVAEAYDMGVEEYLDSGHWNFIEWPDKITDLLPLAHTVIELTKNKNGSRTLNLMPVSENVTI